MSDQLPIKKKKENNNIFENWFHFHPLFNDRPFSNLLDTVINFSTFI